LPVAVLGSSAMNSMRRGYLNGASRPFTKALIRVRPSASCVPITEHSSTAGCCISVASTSNGDTYTPLTVHGEVAQGVGGLEGSPVADAGGLALAQPAFCHAGQAARAQGLVHGAAGAMVAIERMRQHGIQGAACPLADEARNKVMKLFARHVAASPGGHTQ